MRKKKEKRKKVESISVSVHASDTYPISVSTTKVRDVPKKGLSLFFFFFCVGLLSRGRKNMEN